ncbi:MAG: DUF5615 family PIN-like protein [Leptospiraceae bacterium]|nr:DUF5615 family PIN-like protein [Leptospiraceae bacterium]MCP5512433.1 DUF5615 family PIN-like protein [Leptospiraceae bacterium]
MKLLIDANLSWRLLKHLKDFPNSIHVNQTNLNFPVPDLEIWNFALKNGYVILTFDEDFYHLSLRFGHPPKIILIKSENQTSNHVLELLNTYQKEILEFEYSKEDGILQIVA